MPADYILTEGATGSGKKKPRKGWGGHENVNNSIRKNTHNSKREGQRASVWGEIRLEKGTFKKTANKP